MTKTVRFTANTSWVEAASGPKTLKLNPENGNFSMVINTTTPGENFSNTFFVKSVSGENYIDIDLETGDKLFIKSGRQNDAYITWIEKVTS